MERDRLIQQIKASDEPWDIIVIGGGATGLGCAVDAVTRGYKTLLVEQHDFAKGTSSRSTKLIHGGVRYLKQGNIKLVLEALRERGLLMQNAPHLVHHRSFVVPAYRWWEKPFYYIGLKLYDWMAGSHRLGKTRLYSKKEATLALPNLNDRNLRGGIGYLDGQFDDARLAVTLMKTVLDHGGSAINYMKVTGFSEKQRETRTVDLQDMETGEKLSVRGRTVINATGIFTDHVRKLDGPDSHPVLLLSRGVHIVLDRAFHPGSDAVIFPVTDDGRVLFVIPWYHKVIVGTTDVEVSAPDLEPRPSSQEIRYLLDHASQYFTRKPEWTDIQSIYSGLRPLVKPKKNVRNTKSVSRDHTLFSDPSGLITITGGKWTTYRKMGEDAVDLAAKKGNHEFRPSVTRSLKLHGWTHSDAGSDVPSPYYNYYGSDADSVLDLAVTREGWDRPLHSDLPCRPVDVIWGVRHEMARSVEDILCRRTRSLFLNARASVEIAPEVASLMARELGHDENWQQEQMESFQAVAENFLPA